LLRDEVAYRSLIKFVRVPVPAEPVQVVVKMTYSGRGIYLYNPDCFKADFNAFGQSALSVFLSIARSMEIKNLIEPRLGEDSRPAVVKAKPPSQDL
jgi:hypothetical protein